MIPRTVQVHRPESVDEALRLLHQEDAALLAGGTELLLLLRLGLTQVDHLISLRLVPGLRGLERTSGGDLAIGAGTTHQQVADSTLVRECIPALSQAEGRLANLRVRVSGTLAGSLAFADPHSDTLTMLSALGARLECVGPSGGRVVDVDGFLLGPFTTRLEPLEVITRILVPREWLTENAAHERFESRRQRPMATVSCVAPVGADGRLVGVRLVVGSVCPAPVSATATAPLAGLRGTDLDDGVLAGLAAEVVDGIPIRDDEDGSADYKAHVVTALVERALRSTVRDSR